jgi:hypothetical protein
VKGNDGKIIKLASNVSVLTVTNNIISNPIMFISPDRSTIIRGSDPIIQLSLLNISRQSIDLASFLNPSKVNATKVIPENNDLQPNIKANDPEVGHFGYGGGVEDQKASNAWKKANALEIEIIVRDEQGNEHILREVNNPIEKDIGTLILNAGQFIHYKYYVNEYLNEPGKYFIYVVRKMDEQDDSKNDKKIISNTILLTVVAATAK